MQNKSQPYLTKRQIQVILLALQGHTNKEVAKTLCISCRTVDVFWGEIRRKFQEFHGSTCSKSYIINMFVHHTKRYVDASHMLELIDMIREYRDILHSIRQKTLQGLEDQGELFNPPRAYEYSSVSVF